MRVGIFGAALALVAACGVASAQDTSTRGDTRLALFQAGTIFEAGLRNTHTIALTFDDGPNAYTAGVLDALKAANVKATFFIVGQMARAHPELLARIAAEGHLLSNHSASHPVLSSRFDDNPELLIDQVREVNDVITPLMKPTDKLYFRAPYGSWRHAHAAILNADPVLRNYIGPIYWDIGGDIAMDDGYVMSSADWDCWRHKWSAQTCAKGYLREIRRKNGGVVLMHCIHAQSAALVEDVVPAMVEEGYTFVRLDQIQDYKQYETPTTPVVASARIIRAAELIPNAIVK
jgi:peptidoglycan/xylan/chitin deacetylase (PgdA/CDA1 family)